MYNYDLEGEHDVALSAPVFSFTKKLVRKLLACFLVIGFAVLLGFVLVFLPVIFIVELANRQTEKAKITKTYNSLIRRYYNNTLFQV